ncbi:HD-GYP domain-containing protein [Treponema zioleckii]|uniref:HD-GYP domain-containing protein n=1 Tax=Treponema zioleckii TaxID=331680 RepID=UPI00168AF517|nr:diguanylate cyclase [Treponema zioleckii]
MFNFIRQNQLDIMLFLCGMCTAMAAMLFITKFLPRKRRWILICMEIEATLLLFFDRLAYIYAGTPGAVGYIMVRLSNFMVFFITGGIVFIFNQYLIDLLTSEAKLKVIPRRLTFVGIASIIEMLLVILNVFLGFYYNFDTTNRYHRGSAFLFCYIVPIFCPILQFSAIHKYRRSFSHFIYAAIFLYIFAPIVMGIIQIFAYGISIVNMAMVLVSVFLYFFTYLDINAEAEKAHSLEIQLLKSEQQSMEMLFGEAASAFVNALEKQTKTPLGHSERNAQIARRIARLSGKRDEECDKIYYAALLSDAGADSLSYIHAYPFLSETVSHAEDRYDEHGAGIPEYARILAVAKEYERMTSDNAVPRFIVREKFIREAGAKYDPIFSQIAVRMMYSETNSQDIIENVRRVAPELVSQAYRESVTVGIPVLQAEKEISFECASIDSENPFSLPSLILFDSFDGLVHNEPRTIESFRYLEYGEIWFDSRFISTSAKNMEVRNVSELAETDSESSDSCRVVCSRFEDHLLIKLCGAGKTFEVIVALPSASKSAYIALTGENVNLTNISVLETGKNAESTSIPRIAEKIDYTDRIESDLPNIQIDSPLASFTGGVEVKDKMVLLFHTRSLPEANLVWHCPYIVLYSSDDKKMHGKNYHEYAMIKLDGEDNGSNSFATNSFMMKKTESFKSWTDWENQNKTGYECHVEFFKEKNTVTLKTHNKGIYIQNVTTVLDGSKEIFVSLTGDQCALTDIRIR